MEQEITNPRRGWTSGSSAAADLACPGRHLAQRGIREPEASKDAEFGKIIHSALADSGNTTLLQSLTGEQRDIFDACREIEKQTITRFFGEATAPKRVFREQRYWCMVDKKFEHGGQPDVVVRSGPRGLILDYKTLPSDQPESPSNLQLRDYVVLAARTLLMNEVVVAIIQPLVTYTPTLTVYDKSAIDMAEVEMWKRVRASNDPKSPRIPGEAQCKFCLAKKVCKEYSAWAPALLPGRQASFDTPVVSWTPEQRAAFCERRSIAQKWIDDCTEQMKALLKDDPNAIPGWELTEGNNRETVTNPQGLFDRFIAGGGTLEQFMACIKVGKGDFETQVRAVTQLKGKGLKDKVKEFLAGFTESKQDAPSLARKK